MPHQLIITTVYKITLCRRLCQILYAKFYSFTVLVLVLVVVGLVLVLEIYFLSRSRSRHILVSLTSLHISDPQRLILNKARYF